MTLQDFYIFFAGENLIFLCLVVFFVLAVFLVIISVISKILKALTGTVKKTLVQVPKAIAAQKSVGPEKKNIIAPEQMVSGVAMSAPKKEKEQTPVDIKGAEYLSSFKKNNATEKEGTLASKMPSRDENKEAGGAVSGSVKVPTAENNEKDVIEQLDRLKAGQPGEKEKNPIPARLNKDYVKNTGTINVPVIKNSGVDNANVAGQNQDGIMFRGKDAISMREAVADITKKSSVYLKGGRSYSLKERKEIAKKISDTGKFGTILQKSERGRIYKTLEKEKMKASPNEKLKISRQERFLKNVIGK